ncbi:MAG: hypothetical protein R3190_16055 [Thermoanaerobaculia bacterium]|nr:hypothetical protein [Thermoanaerobaculia bacterium]
MSPRAAKKADEAPKTLDDGNITQVRELLFGAQAREFDSRMDRLEQRLARDSAALREEINNRFDSLEAYVKSELQSLTELQREETKERNGDVKSLTNDLGKAQEKLQNNIDKTNDKLKAAEKALRDSLLAESKKLAAELQSRHREVSDLLNSEARDIRHAMTGRHNLGDLLTEIGLRLKDELHLPEPE